MGRSGPGYGPILRGRSKELEGKMERALHGEAGAEEHARELDADEVAARAERLRLDREAAAHAPERDDAER